MKRCQRHLLVLAVFAAISIDAAAAISPINLKCEYQHDPLGIDSKSPRLSWTFTGSGRNEMQTAYEIIVATNLKDIRSAKGSAWATGIVNSGQSTQVAYAGQSLQSFTKYYWRVRVYGVDGKPSAWSEIASFETAMLNENDWTAKWIRDDITPPRDEDRYQFDPMPLFRRSFSSTKKIASARLYISGLGYYEAYLNGQKVGDHMLDPGWTAYSKTVFYVSHDITAMVKNGTNVVGVMLGSGWWNPMPFKLFGRWDLRNYQQTGRPCVKAEIHVRYTDGSAQTIVTDEQWQTATGPVTRNSVYLGEHYDARKERKDWLLPRATNNDWKNAVIASGPIGKLVAQMQPPIRVTRIVKPVAITEAGKDTFIVNMGQNFAGVARVRVKGQAGTTITMRLGEGVFANGSINLMTTVTTQIKKGGIKSGPGAPETLWQEDGYTLKGEGIETWSPRFTFHGFQYVELTGWPGRPTIDDIDGLRMNADLPKNGEFACSNDLFNKIHEAIQWTFLSNVFSVQSDCPGREKMGYGGDMVVTADAFMYNYNMANFYSKSVRDFANDQRPFGGMTEIAPSTGINERGYGDSTGPLAWQFAYPHLQEELYRFYGDRRLIEEQYPVFQKQIAFLRSKADDNLFYWDISDHEALDPKPESSSASVFYYRHVQLASQFAGILGKRDDSIAYAQLAMNIKRSIVAHFYVPGTGRFDNATQSAQLFALWYGMSPEPNKSLDQLISEIDRHGGHLSTGIFGTEMLFDVLRVNDRNDVAYRVANQPDYPGWVNMIRNGATTLWESWSFPETGPSRNHPMFGSIDEWFYRSLLGINPLAPGFERIQVKPQPAGDLAWAKGSYESIRGTIVSEWKIQDGKFSLRVTIPVNTTAEVWLRASKDATIMEGGNKMTATRFEKGYAVMTIGSGDYSFEVSQ